MQKFNSITDFIDELEALVEGTELTSESITSATSIKASDFIDSLDSEEWTQISTILIEGRCQPDIHKQDVYIHEHLQELGYTDDEIDEIQDFAEV